MHESLANSLIGLIINLGGTLKWGSAENGNRKQEDAGCVRSDWILGIVCAKILEGRVLLRQHPGLEDDFRTHFGLRLT